MPYTLAHPWQVNNSRYVDSQTKVDIEIARQTQENAQALFSHADFKP